MPLETYRAKRDFETTPEPSGGEPGAGALRFVVQQHHASRMHWDFRLEHEGVLLSWAVPKGPSFDPRDKRLAVRVEDHPLDYADFEGVIPPGQYGAGSVIVWDQGTWEPITDADAGLAKGDFKFRLFGKKLVGGWVLVRLKPRGNERAENWLLIKERDEHARASEEYDVVHERPESVLSGSRVDQVAKTSGGADAARPTTADPPRTEMSSRGSKFPSDPVSTRASSSLPELALCTLVTAPPTSEGWIAEVKYDGYRLTIELADGAARCRSRAGVDVTKRFARIARAVEDLPAESALLDGEAVVFDDRGATDFSALQRVLKTEPERVSFVAFDLLALNGHDLTPLGTTERKDLLREVLRDSGPPLRIAEHVADDAPAFFEIACAQGLEGAVFKHADAPYPAGRTRAWLKAKCRRSQEFVIGGYTEPRGRRSGFGALLLGVFDEQQKLRYAGRVGSGFSDAQLADIYARLARTERATTPFTAFPPDLASRSPHWVTPALVAQVAFAEWTVDGLLRQPSFLGLRDDVPAAAVRREDPVPSDLGPPGAADGTETPGRSAAVVAGVRVSNPGKQLFPGSGLTKLDLARYYETAAPYILREIAERPLTLVRCPVGDGSGACFYQRHPERGLSQRIRTVSHALTGHETADEWLFVRSVEGLVALAQMGVAEIHTWLSRADSLSRPDRIVFDLDPGPDVTWEQVTEAADILRSELTGLGFVPHVKSTGSKGLHVVASIEPVWEFERVRALTRTVAEKVAEGHPKLLTSKMAKDKRAGRIFVDYVRNSEGASAVAPYSTRHLPGPPVAVPLAWEELADASLDIRSFTPERVMERLAAGVDPWQDLEDSSAGVRVLRNAEEILKS